MISKTIRKKPLFFTAIGFSFLILIQSRFPQNFPANDISFQIGKDQSSIFLGGVIVSEVETRGTSYGDELVTFDLKVKEVSEEEAGTPSWVTGKAKVYLKNSNKILNYGDEILIKGDLKAPKGIRNPGGFDQRAYLDRRGVRALFYGDTHAEPVFLNRHRGNFLREQAILVKRFLSQSLSSNFDQRDAGFLKALFLGERSDIGEEFKDLFIKTGTMHILSVSGFNIGFLSLTIFFLLRPFRISRNLKLWFTLIMVWAYCLLVGWQSPVVRASVMATVLIFAQLLGRRSNILNSLGLAALIILVISPKQLFDVGSQLSFIAVFAIAEVFPIFFKQPELWPNEKWTTQERMQHYAKELFWVSFACLIVTLPITTQSFYIVTPLSVLANMVVVPVSFLLFFAGTIFFLTFWWLPQWFSIVPFVIKLMMKFFVGVLFVMENLPGAYFITGKLDLILWLFLVTGIVWILWNKKIEKPWIRAAALGLFIFNIFMVQELARDLHRKFRMTVLDVGQGDSIYLEFPDGGNLLMDAGKGGEGDRGRWVIGPFLKSKGVSTIDALVASHPQADHIGGMPSIFDEFKVKSFVDAGIPYGTKTFKLLEQKVQKERSSHLIVHRGTEINGFKDVQIRVLNPSEHENIDKNVNNECVVLKVNYGNKSFLLTGDIEEKVMTDMMNSPQDLKADVLKVPHHGARLKEEGGRFVQAVNPGISVISVGEHNAFHHPSEETLSILSSIPGNKVFRTDRDHAVEIVSDGKNLVVKFLNAD